MQTYILAPPQPQIIFLIVTYKDIVSKATFPPPPPSKTLTLEHLQLNEAPRISMVFKD